MKKIKVLHTITRLVIGGAQENTIYTAMLLDKSRYNVDVVSGPQAGPEGSLLTEAIKGKVNVLTFKDLVREINPLKDLSHFIKFYSFLKKEKYQIIHTHSSKAGIIHRVAAKLAGVPIIVHTVHGWSFHDRMSERTKKMYVALEKFAEKFTDKMITVTDFDIEKGLKEKIGSREKYITIHSSIDIDLYSNPTRTVEDIKQELKIPEDRIVIGTVSRMSDQKAPIDFFESASILRKTFDNIHFLFVGDGPLREEVLSYIKSNNLTDCVTLAGLRRDIPDMTSVMDIFCLSSLWEGLPRVFSQAMAAKLPVVATRVNGAPEIIDDEVNGFVVPPAKPDLMAEKLAILIKDEKLRIQMGEKGFKRINPDFCLYNMVRQVDELYVELMKKKGIYKK